MNAIRMTAGLLLGTAVVTGCSDRSPTTSTGAPAPPSAIVLGQIEPGHPYVGAIILDAPSPGTARARYCRAVWSKPRHIASPSRRKPPDIPRKPCRRLSFT